MSKSWQQLEQYVRQLGQVLWNKPLLPERIDGVNFDGVARLSDDEIILIEISEEYNLDKIRSDIAKIASVKLRFAADSIIARAFIVLKDEPTPGMVDVGKSQKIQVISAHTFAQQAFDYSAYCSLRAATPFGSSIDPITGRADTNSFIPVTYLSDKTNGFDIRGICDGLIRKNRLVLLGEYGTGKSRCVREVFHTLSTEYKEASAYTLAINLREHWGALSGIEIIAGHLQRLGLSGSIDRAMQLLQSGSILLLLDGFDEVGTQTFGNSEDRRAAIRKQALSGVRELISMSKGGVLITGRPHYFESNAELIEALGLSLRHDNTLIIRCREEFEELQANAYLSTLGFKENAPQWLPKKPLMFQILASIDHKDAEEILQSKSGEIGFWGQFIDTVCIREAKMHTSIEASTVRSVLGYLARFTRTGSSALGRFSPKDIDRAYELATGFAPDQAGQLMLSRLCTLGRIEPESPDRQFVDPYIVQLLFADCVVEDISTKNHSILEHAYTQPLQPLGLYFLAQWIDTYDYESDSNGTNLREGSFSSYR